LGGDHEIGDALVWIGPDPADEQPFETEPGDHPMQGLDHVARGLQPVDTLGKPEGFLPEGLGLDSHRRAPLRSSVV
jgi:hypothetical protein